MDIVDSSRRWEDLDKGCLVEIFSWLDTFYLVAFVPLVCKSWYKTSLDPRCWARLRICEDNFQPIDLPCLFHLAASRSEGRVTTLELNFEPYDYLPDEMDSILETIGKWSGLKHLSLDGLDFWTSIALTSVSYGCSKLEKLELTGNFFTEEIVTVLTEQLCPRLKHLELRYNDINKMDLLLILKACRNLRCLRIIGCHEGEPVYTPFMDIIEYFDISDYTDDNSSLDISGFISIDCGTPTTLASHGHPTLHSHSYLMEKENNTANSDVVKVKAVWNEKTHATFVRICLEQKILGNKPGHSLNKDDYRNLEAQFFKETGLSFTRTQFKNHWDATRHDWQIWDAVRISTGMGWNVEKNTFSQTQEWWADFAKRYPGGDKFAKHPFAHVDELDMLFGRSINANGKVVFVLNSGVTPHGSSGKRPLSEGTSRTQESFESQDVTSPVIEEVRETSKQQNVEVEDTTAVRKQKEPVKHTVGQKFALSSSRKSNYLKASSFDKLEDNLNKVCQVLVERNKKLKQDANPMLPVMNLLNEVIDIEKASDEWLFAASMLRDSATRDLFIALGDPSTRCAWIKREYRLSFK